MKKMVIPVIVTAIIFTGVGVFADNLIGADKISYTDKNNNETTVEAALNNLYTLSDKALTFGTAQTAHTSTTLSTSDTQDITLGKGKYLLLASMSVAWTRDSELNNASNSEITLTSTNNTTTINNAFCRRYEKTGVTQFNNKNIAARLRNCLYYVEITASQDTISFTNTDQAINTTAPLILSMEAVEIN